jgi:hypothetical protein
MHARGRRSGGGRIIHQARAGRVIAVLSAAWRDRSPRRAASPSDRGEHNLAKPNFAYQKRQKELEKKRKKEEKLKRKVEKNAPPAADAPPPAEGAETA